MFSVDASDAGRGTLDLSVGPPGKTVPHNVKDVGRQLFQIEFIPEEPVDHEVSIQFNDVHIPGKGAQLLTNIYKLNTCIYNVVRFDLNLHIVLSDISCCITTWRWLVVCF